MVPEAFDWHAPAPGLFRLPSDSQGALPPMASVQRIQRNTSWSFSNVPSTFQLCVPTSPIFWIKFPTSLQDGQWYRLCFSVPSSMSQSHFSSSDQPTSYILFCTRPPSTTNFLITWRCLCVHGSLVFLRSIALAPITLLLSTPHTRVWLPISSNGPSWLVSTASSSHPADRPLSCPPPPAPQTARCTTVATKCPDHEFRT